MRKTNSTTNTCLAALAGLLLPTGCATTSGAKGGATGTATSEQVMARNKALDNLIVEALTPCKSKGKPQDNGVIIISAKPDGAVSVGPMQWLGSDEMKQCIASEVPKTHLPAWSGPSVTWIWAVGTKDSPAPKALAEVPVAFVEKQREQVQRAQGNTGMGNDASQGPLSACAQRSLSPESYALVTMRLFIFPEGKVVGATPVANEGEGKDAAFMDCVAEFTREWDFAPFAGPAFTTLDVPLKFGINPADK